MYSPSYRPLRVLSALALFVLSLAFVGSLASGAWVGSGEVKSGLKIQTLVCVLHLGILLFSVMWAVLDVSSYFRRSGLVIAYMAVVALVSHLGRYLGLACFEMSGGVYLESAPIRIGTILNVPNFVAAQFPFWFLRLALGWVVRSQGDVSGGATTRLQLLEALFFVGLASLSVFLIGTDLKTESIGAIVESTRSFQTSVFLIGFTFLTIGWPVTYHGLKPGGGRDAFVQIGIYVMGVMGLIIAINFLTQSTFTVGEAIFGVVIPIATMAGVFSLFVWGLRISGFELSTRRLRSKQIRESDAT